MAERVVDVFEAVQVDEQHSCAQVSAGADRQGLLEAVVEQRAIGQPGDGVMERPAAQFGVDLLSGRCFVEDESDRFEEMHVVFAEHVRAEAESAQHAERVGDGPNRDVRDAPRAGSHQGRRNFMLGKSGVGDDYRRSRGQHFLAKRSRDRRTPARELAAAVKAHEIFPAVAAPLDHADGVHGERLRNQLSGLLDQDVEFRSSRNRELA